MTPLLIFPEGSTSNLRCIRKFRRGAFESECSVTPISVDYGQPYVHPSNEIVADEAGLFLMLCQVPFFQSHTVIYPLFTPTPYLFENYPNAKNLKRWEIYANAVRDMMCEQTGKAKNDQPQQEMEDYWRFMCDLKGKKTVYDTDLQKKKQ